MMHSITLSSAGIEIMSADVYLVCRPLDVKILTLTVFLKSARWSPFDNTLRP